MNKLPLLDWVNANAAYNSTYNWNRMANVPSIVNPANQPGNIATSMGAWSFDGQLNFETLYNKSKYLKSVNQRFSQQTSTVKTKFMPKIFKQKVKLEREKPITITHKLGADNLKVTAIDKSGKIINLPFKVKTPVSIEITPSINTDSLQLTVATFDPNDQTPIQKVIDITARALMLVRKASISYRESNSMVLPGFQKQPSFLGQEMTDNGAAPGYGFTFGVIDKNIIKTAMDNGWLSNNDSIVSPATTAYTSDLDIKATLEPFNGFKIDLNAKRTVASNTSIQYKFEGMPKTFTGTYNITLMALATAFKPIGTAQENYNSEPFNNLLSNRKIIADRLKETYRNSTVPTSGFLKGNTLTNSEILNSSAINLNSADVLIPAFVAAYTGHDVNTVDTNPFLSILSLLPNWRISYDGLSNIGWFKDNFKSVSLTHAYTCRYSIGSYTSYSTWVGMGNDDSALGYVRDVQSGNPIPSSPYDISDVSINEQFSPLIGINVAMKNSMTAKLEYKKQRNMALNLSSTQLIESASDEFVVGLGYVLKDFDVILKLKSDKQTKVKNDLKLSADLSYKDIKTLLRKVEENLTQASSGNKMFTLKIIADYVFSSKVNIQLFYDKQMSTPLISSSYPVSSSNFGVSFKFMLTR